MIDYDSMSFNELISGQIMRALAMHDPQYAELSHDQVANRVTRYCFMGAIAKINGLPFFPKVAEFCVAWLSSSRDRSRAQQSSKRSTACQKRRFRRLSAISPTR